MNGQHISKKYYFHFTLEYYLKNHSNLIKDPQKLIKLKNDLCEEIMEIDFKNFSFLLNNINESKVIQSKNILKLKNEIIFQLCKKFSKILKEMIQSGLRLNGIHSKIIILSTLSNDLCKFWENFFYYNIVNLISNSKVELINLPIISFQMNIFQVQLLIKTLAIVHKRKYNISTFLKKINQNKSVIKILSKNEDILIDFLQIIINNLKENNWKEFFIYSYAYKFYLELKNNHKNDFAIIKLLNSIFSYNDDFKTIETHLTIKELLFYNEFPNKNILQKYQNFNESIYFFFYFFKNYTN